MQLQHIPLSQLTVSAANMRAGKKLPDLNDILPSVRQRGVLVPLLVRPSSEGDRFEIVAGRRRFHAASLAAADGGAPSLPCAILDEGDDASALEASILENVAREDPHEVDQWVSFTRLVREGRSASDIAIMFGLSEREVGQVLALGNLLPKIRELYRAGEIDGGSVKLLTMASKAQQKEWLAILADKDRYTPMGQSLKSWLFGGASIPTSHAIFDLDSYAGTIVTDLFGEGGYFADANQFFEAQRAAIEAKAEAYREAGWSEVVVFEPGQYFSSWDYERTPKSKGGKVYICLSQRGEVAIHEGFLSRKEARRLERGEAGEDKPVRAEITGSLQTYLDLHRHAAVRTALLQHPGVALRLMAAHVLSGSALFTVRTDPRRAPSDAIADSAETAISETRFDEERRKLIERLGLNEDSSTLVQGYGSHGGPDGTAGLFLKLLDLGDDEVMEVVALAMGEALEAGSAVVEAVGFHLGVDVSKVWHPDDAFFAGLRDREVLVAMVAELAGEEVAAANAKEKTAGLKAIVADCLSGANGRERVHGWVPRWMAFPPAAYTARGGVGTVNRYREIEPLLKARADGDADSEPDEKDRPANAITVEAAEGGLEKSVEEALEEAA